MKITLGIFITLFLCAISNAQIDPVSPAPVPVDKCTQLKATTVDFLLDGTLNDERTLVREMSKFMDCDLDSFDVQFFGRMDLLSSILAKITKTKELEQITYNDLYLEINKVKKTQLYKQVREITTLSEQLATTVGSLRTWEHDKLLFNKLGSSERVIAQVYTYLQAHPDNDKTYEAILKIIKK